MNLLKRKRNEGGGPCGSRFDYERENQEDKPVAPKSEHGGGRLQQQ